MAEILRSFLVGQGTGVTPVVNCHAHVGLGWNHHNRDSRAESMVVVMDRCGIHMAAISSARALGPDLPGGNAEVARVVAEYPDRFIGAVVVNPHYRDQSLRDLDERLATSGFAMIKVHPESHSTPANDPAYDFVWRFAEPRRIPVLVHTWGEGRGYDHPRQVGAVAERYPRLPLILAHSGGVPTGLSASVEEATTHPNIYLDTGTSLAYRGAIEYLASGNRADRVLFGTDSAYLSDPPQVGRIAGARIPDDIKRQILGSNLLRLLWDADVSVSATERFR